ncbi:recombination-associated protein RdgC [Noviherbaspirillum pedocola]|uniref:Recombination-associated protein RdgC n=1 Tax=Noviherbaspirillum pedocola TaxID=2801341 RepID=A0A934SY78_9BURK|nr:recombination-associated protein RdgC [Noviherbaspirillum pedocola]MBK4737932.1 recombination-associated protein RdgC [Noviherbaspirillum pedocola]
MWFKNLQLLRLRPHWDMTAERLAGLLAKQTFQPCSGLQAESIGWISPRDDGQLVYAFNRQFLISLAIEKKNLPASTIKQKVKEKATALEQQQGFKPGKKQLREIKEQVIDDLLPKAFPVRSTINVWIDPVHGWIGIDTSASAKSELVLKYLLLTIEQVPIAGFRLVRSPTSAMTEWLSNDEAPGFFTVDNEAELQSNNEGKATVKYTRHSLDAEDIRNHIAAGKQCLNLAMTWNDKISFVLSGNTTLKRIRPLDVLKGQSEAANSDEAFDSEWALMTGELNALLGALIDALGGEVQEDLAA